MKTLTLVRHSIPESLSPSRDDKSRPLSQEGIDLAQKTAQAFLSQHSPDIFITSPATRALQTAQIFNPNPQIIDTLYYCSPGQFLDIIQSIDNKHTHAIFFAHNPTISDLSSILSNTTGHFFQPCDVFTLSFDVTIWSGVNRHLGHPA